MYEYDKWLVSCKEHEDYSAHRPPPKSNKNCSGCWALYNWRHNLDPHNRESRSNLDKKLKPSRRLPSFTSIPKHSSAEEGSIGNYKRFNNYVDTYLGRMDFSFRAVAFGVDASLDNTGIAFIGFDPTKETKHRNWLVGTLSVGHQLSQDASNELHLNRITDITRIVLSCYEKISQFGVKKNLPFLIEDHAYSAGGNRSTRLRELVGVIKTQLYITHGIAPETPSISSCRKKVLSKGSFKGDSKKRIKECLDECHWQNFHKGLTSDEIDAWVVASNYIIGKSKYILHPEVDFKRNKQFESIQIKRKQE